MRWLPALVWLAAILYLGLRPIHVSTGIPNEDKLGHAFAFGVLAWLVWRAQGVEGRRRGAVAFVAAAIAGAVLEFLQRHVPNRSCELADGVASGLGAALAVLVLILLSRRQTT